MGSSIGGFEFVTDVSLPVLFISVMTVICGCCVVVCFCVMLGWGDGGVVLGCAFCWTLLFIAFFVSFSGGVPSFGSFSFITVVFSVMDCKFLLHPVKQ